MPSPFASALLFGYVANYIYDGDAPLAERRAQALSIDQAQLRELLGEAELRELLDSDALADVEAQLQQLDERYRARSVDGVHDLLLHLGDLTAEEIEARSTTAAADAIVRLGRERRIVPISIGAGHADAERSERFIPVEYAARYRDAAQPRDGACDQRRGRQEADPGCRHCRRLGGRRPGLDRPGA